MIGMTYRKNNEYIEHFNEKIINEKNSMWRGDNVKIPALHSWARRRLPKPQLSENCKERKPHDLANKSGQYKRDLSDWEWLCRKCHMESDGRMGNLHRNPKISTPESIKAYHREWHLKHRKEQLEAMKLNWKIWYSNPENREKYIAGRKEKRRIKNLLFVPS